MLGELMENELLRKHYIVTFLLMLLFTIASFWLSNFFINQHASVLFLLLVVVFTLPLLLGTIKVEEDFDIDDDNEIDELRHHIILFRFFVIFILAFVLGIFFWFVVSNGIENLNVNTNPNYPLLKNVVGPQMQYVSWINLQQKAGMVSNQLLVFFLILMNNTNVFLISFIASFLIGAGAIFVLSWNTSILAVGIVFKLKEYLVLYPKPIAYIFAFCRYMIHGIPEFVAFFMAVFSGSLLSNIFFNKKYREHFRPIFKDSIVILGIGYGILILAAVIEVFIIPNIWQ